MRYRQRLGDLLSFSCLLAQAHNNAFSPRHRNGSTVSSLPSTHHTTVCAYLSRDLRVDRAVVNCCYHVPNLRRAGYCVKYKIKTLLTTTAPRFMG